MRSFIDDNIKSITLLTNIFVITLFSIFVRHGATHLVFSILSLTTLLYLRKKSKEYWYIYLIGLVTSLFSVILVYVANMNSYGNPYYIGGSDDSNYERIGHLAFTLNIYDPVTLRELLLKGTGVGSLYYVVIAYLSRLGNYFDGFSTWMPRIMNVFLLLWSSFMLYDLFVYKNKKNAYISVIVMLIFPTIQYINSHSFRDTLNVFLVLWLVWLVVKSALLIRSKGSIWKLKLLFYFGLFMICLYMMYYLRPNSLLYPIIILCFMFFDKVKIPIYSYCNRIYRSRFESNKVVASIATLMLFGVGALMLRYIYKVVNLEYYFDFYTDYITNLGSGGLSEYVYSTPIFPLGIIFRSLYAFVSPLPYFGKIIEGFSSLNVYTWMNLQTISVVFTYFSLPYVIYRLRKFDWISNSFLAIFLSIMLTTSGFRHAIFYLPFLIYLAIDQFLESSFEQRKIYFIDSSVVLAVLMSLYLLLKIVI